MRKCCAVLLTIAVLCIAGCGQNGTTWQEQYDLGVRYLSEGNYEEAAIAFTAAIEIDPKQPEAYLKAAEAYLALDDTDTAIAILEQGYEATADQQLLDKQKDLAKGSVQWNLLTTAQQELLIALDEATERFDGVTVQQLMSSEEFAGLFLFAVSWGADGNSDYFKVEGGDKQYHLSFWSGDGEFDYWFVDSEAESYRESVYWTTTGSDWENHVGISFMEGQQGNENGAFTHKVFWPDGSTTMSEGIAVNGVRVGTETITHNDGRTEVYEYDQQGNLVNYNCDGQIIENIGDIAADYPMPANAYRG